MPLLLRAPHVNSSNDAVAIRLVLAFGCSRRRPPSPGPPVAARARQQRLVLRHLPPQSAWGYPLLRPSSSPVCHEPPDLPGEPRISTSERDESRSTPSSTRHFLLPSSDSHPLPRPTSTTVPAPASAALRKPFADQEAPGREIRHDGGKATIRRRPVTENHIRCLCSRRYNIRDRVWSHDSAAAGCTGLLPRHGICRLTVVVFRGQNAASMGRREESFASEPRQGRGGLQRHNRSVEAGARPGAFSVGDREVQFTDTDYATATSAQRSRGTRERNVA